MHSQPKTQFELLLTIKRSSRRQNPCYSTVTKHSDPGSLRRINIILKIITLFSGNNGPTSGAGYYL